jgi:uncharacterized membrane protein
MTQRLTHRISYTPSGAAAGTKPTSLAAERDHVFVSAAVALHAQEAVLQQAALQVILELLADESGFPHGHYMAPIS